ncbi:MAG: chemotaxis-specific protein-glutamate methyltransferase CheB [Gammaproteobacteria bacterium]|jgi:two-component system response regulator WspF
MKIAIINNKQAARKELIRIVTGARKYELAWSTSSGERAIDFCRTIRPDLILMDPLVRDMDGIEVIRKIMDISPCAILIVTGSVEQRSDVVFDAMGAGAIDAVDTPILHTSVHDQAEQILLRKIGMLEHLTRDMQRSSVEFGNGSLDPVDGPARDNLVIIGCSSGGPEALARILGDLPQGFQSPIVVIQHVDAAFATGLAKWLNVKSALPVTLIEDGAEPVPGQVLLAATNRHLMITADGYLKYSDEPSDMLYRPSVDVFFKSVATHWPHAVTAILLTGMGRDGAAGMLELRKMGAMTIAQDEKSSAVYGMPKAAVELGAAKEVLPIERIARVLVNNNTVESENDLAVQE